MSIVITGVFDGPLAGGLPKGVELYVTADIADLSVFGLGAANNGGGTDGQEFTFPAMSASAGTYIYIASDLAGFETFMGFAPDYVTSVVNINGDDAIELFGKGSVIDTFGQIDVDGTGQPWDYMDGWASRNPGTFADPVFDIGNWSFSGTNALDGATANATAVTPIPIGTYAGDAPPPPPPPPTVITLISEIQGTAGSDDGDVSGTDDISALLGQIVTVSAIVTADFQDGVFGTQGDLNGFYIQEQEVDYDFNDLTSEGLFIFDGSNPAVDVKIGDWVEITGTVGEFGGQTQLSATMITVRASDQVVPSAMEIAFPTTGVMEDRNGNLVANLEAYEGMRVTIAQDMTVTEMFNLDRFGQYDVSSEGRLVQFSQTNEPDQAGYAQHLKDVAARTLVLDDGLSVQNPAEIKIIDGNDGILTADDSFRMGDSIAGITGVVGYSFDEFRIHAAQGDYAQENARPVAPQDLGGNFTVASLNVLNYFTTIDASGVTTDNGSDPRGADTPEEFARQAEKLVNAIVAMDADVLGLIEIENDFAGETFAIKDLVARVNTALGADVYAFVDPGQEFVGGDAIANGLIYKVDKVGLNGDLAILEEFDGRNFIDPLNAGTGLNRPAIAQTFEDFDTGQTLTVSVNHLKSKGSLSGLAADEDQGDGQGNNNATRTEAASILADWLASDPTGQGSENTLILGDLNAYAKEDPLTALAAAGYTDLATQLLGDAAYSYVFDGQIGTLDYVLANAALADDVVGVTEWHVNADEADALDYNLDFGRDPALFDGGTAARNSDHDPVIVSFAFEPVFNLIAGTNKRDYLEGTEGRDRIDAMGGKDIVQAGGGDDIILGGEGKDKIYGGDGNDDIDAGAGKDWVFGGAGDDIIRAGDGKRDFVMGNSGADTFVFSDVFATDHSRDKTIILDFDVTEDMIDLGGAEIDSIREFRNKVEISLDGGHDTIVLRGVDDADEITFVNDLALM